MQTKRIHFGHSFLSKVFSLGTALSMGAFLIFTSCQKENPIPNEKNGGVTFLTASCDSFDVQYSTVLEYMSNPDDPDDTRMNYILYHYAQSVRRAIADPSKACLLLGAMLAEEGDGEISLLDFASENVSFGEDFNSDLVLSISENNVYPKGEEQGIEDLLQDSEWDANSYLKGKFKYEALEYEPTAHFIKRPAECELSRPIVVVIGTDVNDCDDVAGWRGNTEILMGEAEARSTSEIVIFVGVGKKNTPYAASGINSLDAVSAHSNSNDGIEDRTVGDIDVDQHRIKKRFDNSRRSEVMGGWTRYNPAASGLELWGIADDFDPRKIHKNDIGANGTLYTADKDWTCDITSVFTQSLHFFCFEYDWYATNANIENYCVNLSPASLDNNFDMEGRRKYGTDIYFNFEGCSIPASGFFPSVSSTETINNDNGFFVFIRKI